MKQKIIKIKLNAMSQFRDPDFRMRDYQVIQRSKKKKKEFKSCKDLNKKTDFLKEAWKYV